MKNCFSAIVCIAFFFLSGALLLRTSGAERIPAAVAKSAKTDRKGMNVLWLGDFGKAGLGRDDTSVFERALAEASRTGRALEIPVGRSAYRVGPLHLRSHTTVLLDSGVVLQAREGYAEGQKLLNIDDVSEVQIIGYGAILKMNRAEYKTGEYRHCLSIHGSRQVVIRGIRCQTPGGNGLYIGGDDQKPFSETITVEDVTVDGSIGAGLLITSARDVTVRRCHFSQSHAQMPPSARAGTVERRSGIEVLPAAPEARLEQVRLEDNVTTHNSGDGLRLILSRQTARSTPVNITVLRHRDELPGASSYFGSNEAAASGAVSGQVIFQDCVSQGAQEYGAVLSFWSSSGARVSFRALTVIDANAASSTWDNAAVAVRRGGGGRGRIGNVEFIRTTIRDTRRQPKLDYYFSFADYSHIGIENVTFRDAVELSGARHKQQLGLYQSKGVEQIQRADDPALPALWNTAEKHEPATTSSRLRP